MPRPTTPPTPALLLTYAQAADALCVSPRTVRAYADAGHLERVRFPPGRTTRVTAASVHELITASTQARGPITATA